MESETEAIAEQVPALAPTSPDPNIEPTGVHPFALGAYAEAFYQWNFNRPSNGLTNFRGFDNRHNSFTLANVALDVNWNAQRVLGQLTLQIGHTPSTYYLAEPSSPGADGANASGSELWKYLQQAYVGYDFDVGSGLVVTAGLFLSPIGPESMAVRDNWNWSRSNLFFGLPFYHTGVRASYALSEHWALTLAGINGWNSVVDNNDEKSIAAQVLFKRSELALSALYFGGVEREDGAPEGRAWRHLFDVHAIWHVAKVLSLLLHANAGFEPNRFGVSRWMAAAAYTRLRIVERFWFALRGDIFRERVAENQAGRASAIFWPAPWVFSGTATLDVHPHEQTSFRLELRQDRAGADMYFGGSVPGDGGETPFLPNRSTQTTLTLGATTWF